MLRPNTYEQAKAQFKPLARSAFKRKPAKKKKRVKISTLKNKAWAEFSVWVRQRGSNSQGMNQCITCGVTKHWKELQAGHFIAGRLNSNLFDERGCHPQCSVCNVIKAGNGPMYYKFMLKSYGQEVIDELLRQNDQTKKWLPGELEDIAKRYATLNKITLDNSIEISIMPT